MGQTGAKEPISEANEVVGFGCGVRCRVAELCAPSECSDADILYLMHELQLNCNLAANGTECATWLVTTPPPPHAP